MVTGLPALAQLRGGVPKGYARILVFDTDSVLVSQHVQQLSQAALNTYELVSVRVVVPQDGYVSAYVGNESDVDVLFDDITVEHRQGLQVQETQYDPTGLELANLPLPSFGFRRPHFLEKTQSPAVSAGLCVFRSVSESVSSSAIYQNRATSRATYTVSETALMGLLHALPATTYPPTTTTSELRRAPSRTTQW